MSTFVLVHGAWHGGWSWRWVRAQLESHGHRVFTPTMTGVGERTHLISTNITLDTVIDDVIGTLKYEDLFEVILVGHSFAGPVITGVADRIPSQIKQLIYLDAAVLEDGESMNSCISPEIVSERQRLADEFSDGLSFPIPSAEKLGIIDPHKWDYIKRFLTPHPTSTYSSKLSLKGKPGDGFQCTYITCTDPLYEPLKWARKRAEEYGWPIIEIATGHDAMISLPEEAARILMQTSR
jgi:pimeloyl-ACP methyl ester carboxylesterase